MLVYLELTHWVKCVLGCRLTAQTFPPPPYSLQLCYGVRWSTGAARSPMGLLEHMQVMLLVYVTGTRHLWKGGIRAGTCWLLQRSPLLPIPAEKSGSNFFFFGLKQAIWGPGRPSGCKNLWAWPDHSSGLIQRSGISSNPWARNQQILKSMGPKCTYVAGPPVYRHQWLIHSGAERELSI